NMLLMKTVEIYKQIKILNIRQLRGYIIILNNFFAKKHKVVLETKATLLIKTTYRYSVPFVRNEYGKHTQNYYISKLFNTIPESLLSLTKIGPLKKQLKVYLIENPLI